MVEDEEIVRKLTVNALRRKGFSVHSFENAKDSLTFMDSDTVTPHLLITDVVMPGINGSELAKKVKLKHPDCKIIFMSGYRNDILSNEDLNTPEVAFLRKPFATQELHTIITDLLY